MNPANNRTLGDFFHGYFALPVSPVPRRLSWPGCETHETIPTSRTPIAPGGKPPAHVIVLDLRLFSVADFDAELLRVLRVQPLPVSELRRIGTDDPSQWLPCEEPIKDVKADVPTGSTP